MGFACCFGPGQNYTWFSSVFSATRTACTLALQSNSDANGAKDLKQEKPAASFLRNNQSEYKMKIKEEKRRVQK